MGHKHFIEPKYISASPPVILSRWVVSTSSKPKFISASPPVILQMGHKHFIEPKFIGASPPVILCAADRVFIHQEKAHTDLVDSRSKQLCREDRS
ncbi:unnamed protein product [Schistocephalus solidus]|uniref:Uncharacterized protein n=1 Tax=Schistocephalus solidus TaxID=70667 RepID=A0A183T1Q5_SCHSO|nr:unnamed protein product [Schistocephalus solidus]